MLSVSVVIPTFNGSRFIRETLASVLVQTRPPDEIIVVDDASKDGTPEIVREVAAAATAPLRLIELKRNSGGPAAPLNAGIDAARGEYIAMLDHDDLMLPGKIAAKLAIAEKNPAVDLVMADYESFSSEGPLPGTDARCAGGKWHALLLSAEGPLHLVDARDCLSAFIMRPGLAHGCSNMFLRKTLWARTGGFNRAAGACSDYDFLLRAIDRPIAWLDRKLFRRREHGANLWRPTIRNQLQAIRSARACFARHEFPVHVKAEFIAWAAELSAGMRGSRHYLCALQIAAELARLRQWRLAARQCRLTFTYPFRALARKAGLWTTRRDAGGRVPDRSSGQARE